MTLGPRLTRLVRYGMTGLSTNGAVYLIFLGMIAVGVQPVLASGLCYGIGVTLSYLINRRWTFASQQNHKQDLPRFLASYGIGLLLTLLSMVILLNFMGPAVAQLLTIGLTAVAIYIMLNLFGFGGKQGSSVS